MGLGNFSLIKVIGFLNRSWLAKVSNRKKVLGRTTQKGRFAEKGPEKGSNSGPFGSKRALFLATGDLDQHESRLKAPRLNKSPECHVFRQKSSHVLLKAKKQLYFQPDWERLSFCPSSSYYWSLSPSQIFCTLFWNTLYMQFKHGMVQNFLKAV